MKWWTTKALMLALPWRQARRRAVNMPADPCRNGSSSASSRGRTAPRRPRISESKWAEGDLAEPAAPLGVEDERRQGVVVEVTVGHRHRFAPVRAHQGQGRGVVLRIEQAHLPADELGIGAGPRIHRPEAMSGWYAYAPAADRAFQGMTFLTPEAVAGWTGVTIGAVPLAFCAGRPAGRRA